MQGAAKVDKGYTVSTSNVHIKYRKFSDLMEAMSVDVAGAKTGELYELLA